VSASSASDARVRARKRGRTRLLATLMLLTGVAVLPWVIPPAWVNDLVLGKLGAALQLELTRSGAATWRLRGGPMLEVHDLDIGQIGADRAWLHADRLMLAVPWSTVRSLGRTLDVTRIEIDSPRLSLPALRHWLDARTSADGEIPWPTLSAGLEIKHGYLQAEQWEISAISLQLPEFFPDTPVRSKLSGHYTDTATQAGFDLRLAITRPALPAGAAIVGSLDIQRDAASIPVQFSLYGPLRIEHGQWRIPALHLALEGKWSRPDSPPLPFALTVDGALDTGEAITLSPMTLELTGSGPLPSLNAAGEAAFDGDQLHLQLNGEMPLWPHAWPALPKPLDQRTRLGFTLNYTGALDMNGELNLQLQHGPTRLDAAAHPNELSNWLSRPASSPLPPLQGRLSTPVLEFPGILLHGIEIDIESEP